MGTFTVDPNARYKSLPKGEYSVMVRSAEERSPRPDASDPSKQKYPYIEVVFEVIEGEYKGENFTDRFSLSPKAEPRLASFVHACGLVDPSSRGKQVFRTEDLVHKVLVVRGSVESFNGFERFRPTSFLMHTDVARVAEKRMSEEVDQARRASSATPSRRPI